MGGVVGIDGEECGLGVEGIEDGFDDEYIGTTIDEGCDLGEVCTGDLIEIYGPVAGVVNIGGHGEGFVHWADGSGYEGGVGRMGEVVLCYGLAGEGGCCVVDVVREVLHVVVGEGDGLSVECVGLNDVCAGLQVLEVYVLNDVWLGEREEVVVPFEVGRPDRRSVCRDSRFR